MTTIHQTIPTAEQWEALTQKLDDVFGKGYGTELTGNCESKSSNDFAIFWRAYHAVPGHGQWTDSPEGAVNNLLKQAGPILLEKAAKLRVEADNLEAMAGKLA